METITTRNYYDKHLNKLVTYPLPDGQETTIYSYTPHFGSDYYIVLIDGTVLGHDVGLYVVQNPGSDFKLKRMSFNIIEAIKYIDYLIKHGIGWLK